MIKKLNSVLLWKYITYNYYNYNSLIKQQSIMRHNIIAAVVIVVANICNAFVQTSPYLLGTYLLRKTNDGAINTKYAYLILNDDNNIKLKTIVQNGVFGTKISKTGRIEYKTNVKNAIYKLFGIGSYDITVRFNNVNKYSYSFFGIEFPEIRYKQISNYNIERNMNVRYKDDTLYVSDKDLDNYYLFDLYGNLMMNRLPFVELSLNTLVMTQIISFVINLLLVKTIRAEFGNFQ